MSESSMGDLMVGDYIILTSTKEEDEAPDVHPIFGVLSGQGRNPYINRPLFIVRIFRPYCVCSLLNDNAMPLVDLRDFNFIILNETDASYLTSQSYMDGVATWLNERKAVLKVIKECQSLVRAITLASTKDKI